VEIDMGNESIGSILKSKGNGISCVDPTATVFDAISMMAEKGIAAVLVMRDGALLGIVSVKDYARELVLKGRDPKDVTVAEIMTTAVVTISPDRTVSNGLAIMTRERIRHLPVLADGNVVGVVSMADLARSLVSEQAFTIDQLQRYVGQK
jgi:CBS domain-containing protein